MFRRKFKGPCASAAKQVVAIKPGAETSQETQPKSSTSQETVQPPTESNVPETVVETPIPPTDDSANVSTSSASQVKPILVDKNKKRVLSGLKSPVRFSDEVDNSASASSSIESNANNVEAVKRPRTASQSSVGSSRPISPSPPKKRVRKLFEKDEDMDPTKFTMADLIDFKPKGVNNLRKKWKDLEKKFKEEGFAMKTEKVETTSAELCPQVKMDADGNVIIDEDSLTVRRNPEAEVLEAVDDDLIPKKINSLSFRKNYSRASMWTELETELFYEVLSATGTDFSMMNEYLPFKSRADIKKKFRKEEKANLQRINRTLRNPSILNDDYLKPRVDKLMNQIDDERAVKEALKEKKLSGKRGRKDTLNSVQSVASDASGACALGLKT